MPADLHELLSRDHERLDALLVSCVRADRTIDYPSYDAFRRGLLRHIGIEERILFPQLRLAALLVPPPSAVEIEQIRALLREHNPLEENAGGVYEVVDDLAGEDRVSSRA